MPKAKKNDYQDWNVPSKDGPSKGGLGPRMVHEDPSSPPYNDPDLKQGQGPVHDEGIDVDVKEMVRRYEKNDIRDLADDPERNPAIDISVERDQSDNHIHQEENLGPSFEHEEQYENQAFQPDETAPEPASFHHEDPPLLDRGSSHYINRQQSSALPPVPPAYEFDAAAAREASKELYAEHPSAQSVNQRRQADTLPAVPSNEMTASPYDRKSGSDYRFQKDSLPPVPGYDDGDDIAAEKRKAARAADRMSLRSRVRSRGNDMVDYVMSKTKSKSSRTVVVLVASAVLFVIIAILFMIIYFSTGHQQLQSVTIQPTDAMPTDTGGSIVIVGVNLDATVRLSNRAFIPQYNNDLSPQYKSLADNFTNTMDDVFYGSDLSGVYNGTVVNGFSPGSVIVDFVIQLLSPPVAAPGDTTTPSGSIEDRLKKIEEDVQAAVQDVIADAADDGNLDELGVDSTSFVVTDVGVDVRVMTEAPTLLPPSESTQTPDTSPPAITCPDKDLVYYLETGEFTANVTWSALNATDNSGQVTVTTDMTQGLWDAGEYTVVAMATDPSGNSAQCSFNIKVGDRTCPAGWLRRADSCYRLSWADSVPYATALQLCTELDAIPVVPNSQAEFDFVVEFLGDLVIPYLWLGCDDNTEEGRWACLDGSRIPTQSGLQDAAPLGMESGTIPDSSLTASSMWNSNHGPKRARLNVVRVGALRGAWSARYNDPNQWIQVDLLTTYLISGVATQGRSESGQWVTSFRISCSTDGINFDTVQDPDTDPVSDKVFPGNSDRNTVVNNTLPVAQVCRYVRLLPTTWRNHISLRMELYGQRSVSGWWAPGQPNSRESENCVVLVFGAFNLHDFPCTFDQPRTLCEKVAE